MKWDKLREYVEETIEYSKTIKHPSDREDGFRYGLEDIANKMRNLEAEENTRLANKYWIPEEDSNIIDAKVTIGKEYKVIWDSSDEEEVIIDDTGAMTLDFMWHEGRYIYK